MFVEIGLNAYLYFMAPATSVTVSSKTAELGDDLAGSAGRAGRTVRLAHTITLSILLVLAWIALGTGIKQFGVRYGDNGLITASLAIYAIYIVLLVAGLIFIGERYMKRTQKLPEINMGTIQDFTDTLNRKVEAAVSSLKGSAEAAATSKKYPTGAAGSDVLGYEADDQVLVNKSPYTQLED